MATAILAMRPGDVYSSRRLQSSVHSHQERFSHPDTPQKALQRSAGALLINIPVSPFKDPSSTTEADSDEDTHEDEVERIVVDHDVNGQPDFDDEEDDVAYFQFLSSGALLERFTKKNGDEMRPSPSLDALPPVQTVSGDADEDDEQEEDSDDAEGADDMDPDSAGTSPPDQPGEVRPGSSGDMPDLADVVEPHAQPPQEAEDPQEAEEQQDEEEPDDVEEPEEPVDVVEDDVLGEDDMPRVEIGEPNVDFGYWYRENPPQQQQRSAGVSPEGSSGSSNQSDEEGDISEDEEDSDESENLGDRQGSSGTSDSSPDSDSSGTIGESSGQSSEGSQEPAADSEGPEDPDEGEDEDRAEEEEAASEVEENRESSPDATVPEDANRRKRPRGYDDDNEGGAAKRPYIA